MHVACFWSESSKLSPYNRHEFHASAALLYEPQTGMTNVGHPGFILVISSRPAPECHLTDAVRKIAECQVLTTTRPWAIHGPVLGVIVDVDLRVSQNQACLKWLWGQFGSEKPPSLFLTNDTTSANLREARENGATACLHRLTEARSIVAALFRLIFPGHTLTDYIVRSGVSRTDRLFEDMFGNTIDGTLDLVAVEGAIEPVLSAIQDGGLTRWLDIVWEHDGTSYQHCLLVAGLTTAFAQGLGFSNADQILMARGALVHDIGKAQIPLEILNKPGKLDSDELAVMRTHAAIGHQILMASGQCDPISLAMTRHHHEMLDGSGYPDALSSNEISDPIRLLTICDIYAALIERRPYKLPYSSQEAMRILNGMMGKLDAALVHAFGNIVASADIKLRTAAA